ncbi:hypothetical protein LUZ60_015439 [Juncus effusus]|nr:hypothetical protein LUZ60_015439 [Juncus effusus]
MMASLHFPQTGRLCFSSPLKPPRSLPGFISLPSRQQTRIYSISSNDIRIGSNIEIDGAPFKVLEFLHVKPGKGAAFIRTKVKNYLTGNTVDKTFRAGSTIDEADILKEAKQYTYKDGNDYVFMDLATYEEVRVDANDVGNDKTVYLKEGTQCNILFWNGKVIDVDLPSSVTLTVVEADGPVGSDASNKGGSRLAKLDTGLMINVPAFVKEGESVVVDTRSGQYVSRA